MIIKDLNGIVFNLFNYKENDLIVDVFTKEYGFMQLYIRGGQKTTSKSFFVFSKFNIIKFDLSKYNNNGLSIYKSGSVLKAYDFINLSFEQINLMMLFEELLEKIKHEKIVSDIYFETLISIIYNSKNNNISHLFLINYLLVQTLKNLGCELTLDKCFHCESKTKIKVFDYEVNGFVCENCLENSQLNTFEKDYLIYFFNLNTYNNYDIIESKIEKEIFKYLSSILFDNAGIYLVSQKFI